MNLDLKTPSSIFGLKIDIRKLQVIVWFSLAHIPYQYTVLLEASERNLKILKGSYCQKEYWNNECVLQNV